MNQQPAQARSVAMSPADVRARIDELLDLWFSGDKRDYYPAARRENELIAVSVFPLAAHAHALARAIRVLDDAGMSVPTVGLTRQVLECAATAMWIEVGGVRAARVMQREYAHNRLQTFEAFVETGAHEDPEVLETWSAYLSELDSEAHENGQRFYQRCEEVEGLSAFYGWYRALSSVSHAGGAVMELYTKETAKTRERPVGVALSRSPKPWADEAVLGYTLVMLLYAAMAWDRLDKDHPSRSRLKQIAAELGVRLEWQLSAAGFRNRTLWEKEQRRAARAAAKDPVAH